MKAKAKKLTALVLALLMAVAIVPMTASAAAASVNDLVELETAIQNMEDIVLADDIEGNVTFPDTYEGTLDLNGKTILGTTTNDGVLTIKDTSEEESGMLIAKETGEGNSALTNNGTLTIEGGTFTREADTNWYVVVNKGTVKEISGGVFENAVSSAASATFINYETIELISGGDFIGGNIALKVEEEAVIEKITGGTYTSTTDNGSALQNWGEVTIEGGTFEAGAQGAAVYTLTFDDYDASTTIDGGTFKGGRAVLAYLYDKEPGDASVTVTINDGTFLGDIEMKSQIDEDAVSTATASIEIHGGTFEGELKITANDPANPGATLTVKGGSFKVDDDYTVTAETVEVEFLYDNGETETESLGVAFTDADYQLGDELPLDAKAGYVFNGWNFQNAEEENVKGTYQTVTAELLAALQNGYEGTALTATPVFGSNLPFTDVPTDQWFYDAAVFVYENALFEGTSPTVFSPNKNMNRAMMVQVLYNMTEDPEDGAFAFSDVDDDQWYFKAVSWAGKSGVVNGVGNNRFAPLNDITREQMALMLYNYAEFMEIELPETRPNDSFSDADSISDWAKDAVEAMYAAEVINGKGEGRFDPQGKATRAQVAEMFMNFMNVTAE